MSIQNLRDTAWSSDLRDELCSQGPALSMFYSIIKIFRNKSLQSQLFNFISNKGHERNAHSLLTKWTDFIRGLCWIVRVKCLGTPERKCLEVLGDARNVNMITAAICFSVVESDVGCHGCLQKHSMRRQIKNKKTIAFHQQRLLDAVSIRWEPYILGSNSHL